MRAAVSVLGEYSHRVLIHMPTGSGKTCTAMSLLAGLPSCDRSQL
ncbi:MAG: DEAD/DEAH box helicase family protein [bacterium]|nr:DEAD/DEAH box helicase family protein [bacterium]